jgi:hypothetical protein
MTDAELENQHTTNSTEPATGPQGYAKNPIRGLMANQPDTAHVERSWI